MLLIKIVPIHYYLFLSFTIKDFKLLWNHFLMIHIKNYIFLDIHFHFSTVFNSDMKIKEKRKTKRKGKKNINILILLS